MAVITTIIPDKEAVSAAIEMESKKNPHSEVLSLLSKAYEKLVSMDELDSRIESVSSELESAERYLGNKEKWEASYLLGNELLGLYSKVNASEKKAEYVRAELDSSVESIKFYNQQLRSKTAKKSKMPAVKRSLSEEMEKRAGLEAQLREEKQSLEELRDLLAESEFEFKRLNPQVLSVTRDSVSSFMSNVSKRLQGEVDESSVNKMRSKIAGLNEEKESLEGEVLELVRKTGIDFSSDEIAFATLPEHEQWAKELERLLLRSQGLIPVLEAREKQWLSGSRMDDLNEVRKNDLVMKTLFEKQEENVRWMSDKIIGLVRNQYERFSDYVKDREHFKKASKGMGNMFKTDIKSASSDYEILKAYERALQNASLLYEQISNIVNDPEEVKAANPHVPGSELDKWFTEKQKSVNDFRDILHTLKSMLGIQAEFYQVYGSFKSSFNNKEKAWDVIETELYKVKASREVLQSLPQKKKEFEALESELSAGNRSEKKVLRVMRKKYYAFVNAEKNAEEASSPELEENLESAEEELKKDLMEKFKPGYNGVEDSLVEFTEKELGYSIEELKKTAKGEEGEEEPLKPLPDALREGVKLVADSATSQHHTFWQRLRWLWGLGKAKPESYLGIVDSMFGEEKFAELYLRSLPISYAGISSAVSSEIVSELIEKQVIPDGFSALDLGSGPSTFTRALNASKVKASVTDLDFSKPMLDRSVNEKTIHANMVDYDGELDEYDLLNMSCSLQFIPLSKRGQVLYSFGSALKTGGVMLVTLSPADAPSPDFSGAVKEMGFEIIDSGVFVTALDKNKVSADKLASVREIYYQAFGDELGRSVLERLSDLLEKEVSFLVAVKRADELSLASDPYAFVLGEREQGAVSQPSVVSARRMRKQIPDPELPKLDAALLLAVENGDLEGASDIAERFKTEASISKKIGRMLSIITTEKRRTSRRGSGLSTEDTAKWQAFVSKTVRQGNSRELEIAILKAQISTYGVDEAIERVQKAISFLTPIISRDLERETFKLTLLENMRAFHSQLRKPDEKEAEAAFLWVSEGREAADAYAHPNGVSMPFVTYLLKDAHMLSESERIEWGYVLTPIHREAFNNLRL